MSKGTYCSASQRIDSASSSGDMAGSEIFLMMTEWPDRDVPNSGFRTFSAETIRLTVSTTREASMIAPSTIASGERLSRPVFTRRYPPPFASFSSTSLIAEDPISSPTRFLDFLNSTRAPPTEKIQTVSGFFLWLLRLVAKIAKGLSLVKSLGLLNRQSANDLSLMDRSGVGRDSCSSLLRVR